MNLREGTRRLALLLGAVGAIAGGFVSYAELKSILHLIESHKKFEQLANSGVVKHECKCRLAGVYSGCRDLPNDFVVRPITDFDAQGKPIQWASSGQSVEQPQGFDPNTGERKPTNAPHLDIPPPPSGHIVARPADGVYFDGNPSVLVPSVVMEDGIRAINWSHDYGISSIETEDSQTLYPTPRPAAWTYLLVLLYPTLGFFIPWGAICAAAWVGVGFVQPPK